MGIIRQLPPHEIQKIAAGEVVERPASVVKELLENALDAGATAIDIYVQEGGKSLIRLIDNGCGIAPDDLLMTVIPHATSKISSVNDLERLHTFGFRGEALASIAAVSHCTIRSRPKDALAGNQLEIQCGEPKPLTPVGMPVGTDICIKGLFDNVPARKKFLRSVDTEWRQIINLVQAYALSFPQVHFKLYHYDHLTLHCPPIENLSTRVHQIWDEQIARSLLKIDATHHGITLRGAVSNHQFMRYARSHWFLFVNNRWVRHQGLFKAAFKAYNNVLQDGKFPALFLFLTIDPSQVDVNIHPRKEEVQFSHTKELEALVYQTVKNALQSVVTSAPRPLTFIPARSSSELTPIAPSFMPEFVPAQSMAHPLHPTTSASLIENILAPTTAPSGNMIQVEHTNETLVAGHSTLIGQLRKTYLLVEKESGLWLIDQHAAHERILYESFRTRFTEVASTRLLFAHEVELDPFDLSLLIPYLELLKQEGLELEMTPEHKLALLATPSYAKNIDFTEFIQYCIQVIKEHAHLAVLDLFKELKEKIHAMMACKAAVKAGDDLQETEMKELIAMLEKTANNLTCPHGRPTTWLVSWYELERHFKRVG